jgi:hypothetical protein
MGFQCTGIGAFFDDEVHRYLEIPHEEGQVVYRFAAGLQLPTTVWTGTDSQGIARCRRSAGGRFESNPF